MKMIRKETTRQEQQVFADQKAAMELRGNIVPASLRPRTEREVAIESQLWKAAQIARSFHTMTGLAYAELYGEACMCICRIYETWCPEKGANFS